MQKKMLVEKRYWSWCDSKCSCRAGGEKRCSLAFIFASHFFSPMASISFLLPPPPPRLRPSLSVTSSSLLQPSFLSEYLIPRGWAALLFLLQIGAQGQGESSSAKCLESFSAVSTRTNSSSLLLNGSPILTLTLTLFFFMLLPRLRCCHRPPVPRCASVRARGVEWFYVQACLNGRSRQKPRFPRWNNWFNKLPAMFHSKEVAGAKRGRRSQEIN